MENESDNFDLITTLDGLTLIRDKLLEEIQTMENAQTEYEVEPDSCNISKENVSDLQTRLKFTEKLNGIFLQQLSCEKKDDNLKFFKVYATTGNIDFNINYAIKLLEDGESTAVSDLEINFKDPKIKLAKWPWTRKCLSNNNIQVLLRGIKEYDDLLQNRQLMINKINEEYNDIFTVEINDDENLVIEAYDHKRNERYLKSDWDIIWDKTKNKMDNSLKFFMGSQVDFPYTETIQKILDWDWCSSEESEFIDLWMNFLQNMSQWIVDRKLTERRSKKKNG